MTKPLLLAPVVVMLLSGCRKPDSLPGSSDIGLHVTITNDVNGTGTPQDYSDKYIYVANTDDAINYLFSVKTDASGNALVKGLAEEESYDVYAHEMREGLQYSGRITIQADGAGQQHLDLRPGNSDQNGFLITCTDAADGPLPNLRVRVYTSLALAQQNDSNLAYFKGNTDSFGRVSKTETATTSYYARIRSLDQQLDTTVSVPVNSRGITRITCRFVVPSPTGLRLVIRDSNGAGIPQVNVCAFATAALAQAGDCASAAFQGATGPDGSYQKVGIPPQTYHVRARNALLGLDTTYTCDVQAQTICETTIDLPPITILQLSCIDLNGAGIPGLTIRAYVSPVLAASNDPALATFELPAVGNGVYRKEGMAAQQYWLRITSGAQGIDAVEVLGVTASVLNAYSVTIGPTGFDLFCHDGNLQGIPGLVVQAYTTEAFALGALEDLAVFTLEPQGIGHYRNTGLVPGTYWLSIRNEDIPVDTVQQILVQQYSVNTLDLDVIP
ncbi:MAG: hypothetical protein IPK70_14695 [Flavobacteriales bacterium]|jgi:hypothetical protein|nr:hypothetical protein [Flavobacteriales bacterium]